MSQRIDPAPQARPPTGNVARTLLAALWDVVVALGLAAVTMPFLGVYTGVWTARMLAGWEQGRHHGDIDIAGLLMALATWGLVYCGTFLAIGVAVFLVLRVLPPALRRVVRVAAVVLAAALCLVLAKVISMPASLQQIRSGGRVGLVAPHAFRARCTMDAECSPGPDA